MTSPSKSPQRITTLLVTLAALGIATFSGAACAHRPLPVTPVTTAALTAGTQASLQVRDRDTGASLPIYRYEGRLYVAGTPGHRYAVTLANHLPARGLFVVSVDGVNALTGESASYAQAGYVLQSGQRFDVNGWRKSTREVAAFTFTALPNSYAARTGRPQEVGAIGVALFRELAAVQVSPMPPVVPMPSPYELQRGAAPQASRSAEGKADSSIASSPKMHPPVTDDMPMPEMRNKEKLGTGHGERERSVVERTSFERSSHMPDEVITIYYDSRDNLIAQGILPREDQVHDYPRKPRPFPAQPVADTRGFVPDPWRY